MCPNDINVPQDCHALVRAKCTPPAGNAPTYDSAYDSRHTNITNHADITGWDGAPTTLHTCIGLNQCLKPSNTLHSNRRLLTQPATLTPMSPRRRHSSPSAKNDNVLFDDTEKYWPTAFHIHAHKRHRYIDVIELRDIQ